MVSPCDIHHSYSVPPNQALLCFSSDSFFVAARRQVEYPDGCGFQFYTWIVWYRCFVVVFARSLSDHRESHCVAGNCAQTCSKLTRVLKKWQDGEQHESDHSSELQTNRLSTPSVSPAFQYIGGTQSDATSCLWFGVQSPQRDPHKNPGDNSTLWNASQVRGLNGRSEIHCPPKTPLSSLLTVTYRIYPLNCK